MYPGVNAAGQLHRHGTSCAGVLVMAKDNEICGVGVAYSSKLAGIRLLSGSHHSDATEAIALGLNRQHIDIYSNSWGPYDDGIVVDGPGKLALATMEQGVRKVLILAGIEQVDNVGVQVARGSERHDLSLMDQPLYKTVNSHTMFVTDEIEYGIK